MAIHDLISVIPLGPILISEVDRLIDFGPAHVLLKSSTSFALSHYLYEFPKHYTQKTNNSELIDIDNEKLGPRMKKFIKNKIFN